MSCHGWCLWGDGVRRRPTVQRDRPADGLGRQHGFRASARPRARTGLRCRRFSLRLGRRGCRHTVAYDHAVSSAAERSPGVSSCRGSARFRDAGRQLCSGKARVQNRSADCHPPGIDATERQPVSVCRTATTDLSPTSSCHVFSDCSAAPEITDGSRRTRKLSHHVKHGGPGTWTYNALPGKVSLVPSNSQSGKLATIFKLTHYTISLLVDRRRKQVLGFLRQLDL